MNEPLALNEPLNEPLALNEPMASTKSESREKPVPLPPRPEGAEAGGLQRPLQRNVARAVKIALAAAVIGAVAYRVAFAPVKVLRHAVSPGEVIAEVMGTGTIEARVRAEVGPKISGLLTEVLVDQGDRVLSGETLILLDDRDLRGQVELAEAGVAAAEAAIDRLLAEEKRAEAVLEQARLGHRRIESLLESQVASSDEFDRSVEALRVAEANLASARAATVEGRRILATAKKTMEYQQARLADTVVLAPFNGLIVRRERDPGSVVVPGTSVLSLVSLDEIWISAWVDETEMARIQPGQKARVVFRSEPDRSYPGEVARLGRQADRETREFLVDVKVESLPENWAVGQRAEVYIETARKAGVPVIPPDWVVWRDASPGVFLQERGRAAWRPISLGLRGIRTVEVVEGLEPGQSVVAPADPKETIRDGQRVTEP